MARELVNAGFEGGWTRDTATEQAWSEIFVPEGWVAFWKEGGPVPHDPQNRNGYGRPEMRVINREPPFLSPPRVHAGQRAVQWFTFWRIHDAGIYQRVAAEPGERLAFTAWAHAWSSDGDNAYASDVDGDGHENFTFRAGIDPTGGTDPWASSVVWGLGAHIYNAYAPIPAAEATAAADAVTVFIRSTVLWPFKHCDAYVDAAQLVRLDDEPAPGHRGAPRVQYRRWYHCLPPGATRAQAHAVLDRIFDSKGTLGWSTDDAGIGDLDERHATLYGPEQWDCEEIEAWYAAHYPGVQVHWED